MKLKLWKGISQQLKRPELFCFLWKPMFLTLFWWNCHLITESKTNLFCVNCMHCMHMSVSKVLSRRCEALTHTTWPNDIRSHYHCFKAINWWWYVFRVVVQVTVTQAVWPQPCTLDSDVDLTSQWSHHSSVSLLSTHVQNTNPPWPYKTPKWPTVKQVRF